MVIDCSSSVYALLSSIRVGDRDLQRIDLLECDADDQITTLTIMIRPLGGSAPLRDAISAAAGKN
ncbi:hypothetical protein ACFXG4_11940 [Nocardia sp. NPDC059246]|uniref:hypothetical protein n=1 Tax=unclassified Nocardia TaxID=2637762 RepID=UPI0036C3BD06